MTIEILSKSHLKSSFDCGNASLNHYIQNQASQDVKRNISVCYVLSNNPDKTVAGYYTLSSHSIALSELPEELAKKLPQSYKDIPTALLGRLAVSTIYQGKRLGATLLFDALNRCTNLAESIGTLAVVVDPIDEKATSFYKAYGFISLPNSERMFIPVKTIKDLQGNSFHV